MSEGIVVLVIGGCWLFIGLALAIEMGRRGYETYGWAVLGALMGPFAIVLALDAVRHKDETRRGQYVNPVRSRTPRINSRLSSVASRAGRGVASGSAKVESTEPLDVEAVRAAVDEAGYELAG